MANIIDYLKWRGDLPFLASPFGAVDNLILSYLAYVNLDQIAPGPGEKALSLSALSQRFFQRYSDKELKKDHSFVRLAPYVMQAMAASIRFRNALVKNYVNEISAAENLQFSAMEIQLDDRTSYIAFRGTDDTIVGWKEDFILSNGVVNAQVRAVEYLNRAGDLCPYPLRVGGHSKGGNLCIYAAAACKCSVQDKIVKVYCNDGPGFTKEFLQSEGYVKIKPRILRIVPEASVIGMLLNHSVKPAIISSSQLGLLQHDGMSWEVMGPAFITKERINPKADLFNQTLATWINNMEQAQRVALIDELFSILEATGAQTLTEFQEKGVGNVPVILHKIEQLDPANREIMESLLGTLVRHWKDFI